MWLSKSVVKNIDLKIKRLQELCLWGGEELQNERKLDVLYSHVEFGIRDKIKIGITLDDFKKILISQIEFALSKVKVGDDKIEGALWAAKEYVERFDSEFIEKSEKNRLFFEDGAGGIRSCYIRISFRKGKISSIYDERDLLDCYE